MQMASRTAGVLSILMATSCVHAIHRRTDAERLLSVSFVLQDYSTFTFLTRPTVPQPLPPKQSLVVGANGGGFAIDRAQPGQPAHVVFLLYEKQRSPGPEIMVLVTEGAFDRTMTRSTTPSTASMPRPCVSVSPFFIEGVGASPVGALSMRHFDSDGYDVYGILKTDDHILRVPPALTVTTKQVEPLWKRGGTYSLLIKSLFFSDDLVVAVQQRENGSYNALGFKPSFADNAGGVSGLVATAGQSTTWRIFVIADPPETRSPCRSLGGVGGDNTSQRRPTD